MTSVDRRPALGETIVPNALRRPVLVLTLASALVVVLLGIAQHGSSGAGPADRAVASAVRSRWGADALAYGIDGLVTVPAILGTLAVLAVAGLLVGRRRLALLAVLGPCCVAGATTALKPVVDRTIHGANLAYPSGHTGYAAAVGLVLGLLLVGLARTARPGPALLLLVAPAVVLGGVMAVDQVVLDAHYASDTVGGWCTALAVVGGLALALDAALDRRLVRST